MPVVAAAVIQAALDAECDLVTLVRLEGVSTLHGRISASRNSGASSTRRLRLGCAGTSGMRTRKWAWLTFLALEGAKYNIWADTIESMGASAMTETIMPHDMLAGLKPEFVAPFVATLVHPDGPEVSGRVFEVGAGYAAEIRWERSKSAVLKTDVSHSPSAIAQVPCPSYALSSIKSSHTSF